LERLKSPTGHLFSAQAKTIEGSAVNPDPVTVFAAVSSEEDESLLESFKKIGVGILALSAGLSLLMGWTIAHHGLKPLSTMTKAVSRISSKNLHQRVSLRRMPTELHDLTIAFNQTLDRLQDAFVRQVRFSGDIAHELRTPITNMLGEIEVTLTKQRNSGEYRDVLSSCLEECTRMKQIIESLLFLSRAENSEKDLHIERVEAIPEIESVIQFFEAPATEAGVRLVFEPRLTTARFIAAERMLFQRALGNIIANSIKYSHRGGIIEVAVSGQGDVLAIEVRDNGKGIPAEHLNRIFDRFYRVDPSRANVSGGFGLGLAIVKSIVDLHRAKIQISSEPGFFTQVTVRWPTWQEQVHS
jgi:two-component system heavy metal sensor histidine kinase CusS